MASNREWAARLGILVLVFWTTTFLLIYNHTLPNDNYNEVDSLSVRIRTLEALLAVEKAQISRLKSDVEIVHDETKRLVASITRKDTEQLIAQKTGRGPWTEPIPVLVFACNRPDALKTHVSKLLALRPSATLFPIVISQDCDSLPTAKVAQNFNDQVIYVKHLAGEKANITIPTSHHRYTAYYRIARHYKLALTHVFDTLGYNSVIINEDDLDIAPDFFEYFSATRYLLESDKSLFCVSAWNDNGKPENIDSSASNALYRSDFFPGLGWMMSRDLWKEFKPIWPAGFWDDWLREPERRLNRSCIRPEISRTSMTRAGKKGASEGLFFTKHLIKIVLNNDSTKFTEINLDHLKKENYDDDFEKAVYKDAQLVDIDQVTDLKYRGLSIRVEYNGNIDYIKKADRLHIMHDFKAGVPRTAYKGVVSTFWQGVRVYLAPDRNFVKGYVKDWEVPAEFGQ